MPIMLDIPSVHVPGSTSLLIPSTTDSSLILRLGHTTPSLKFSGSENPFKQGGDVNNSRFEFGKDRATSILPEQFFANAERGYKPQMGISKNFKHDGLSTPGTRHVSPVTASPLKEFNRSSLRVMKNSHLQRDQPDEASPDWQENGFIKQLQNISTPYSRRVTTDPIATTSSLFNDSAQDRYSNVSGRRAPSDRPDRPWTVLSTDDPMDVSWRY